MPLKRKALGLLEHPDLVDGLHRDLVLPAPTSWRRNG
jgi:hypothetical protein